MYLDHPKITATNSNTEPDRLERLNRVYGYALGLADQAGDHACVSKLVQLHDHKGTLVVTWFEEPTATEKYYFTRAWKSLVGDQTNHVEHKLADA